MRTAFKLLVLSMFLTTGFAFVGCEGETKTPAKKTEDVKDESKDEKTSKTTDDDSAELVAVSLKIPKLKPN